VDLPRPVGPLAGPESLAARILAGNGASHDDLRRRVVEKLSGSTPPQ
jgi:hypothetical protein